MRRFPATLPFLLVACLLFVFAPARIVPQEGEGGGGAPDAVRKVVSQLNGMGSFKARLTISSAGGGLISGRLAYQKGMVHLKLGDGRVVAANGKALTVFDPGTGVAGRQDMYSGGGGLGWILSGFTWKVVGGKATGTAVNPGSGVAKVELRWGDGYTLRNLTIYRGQDATSALSISLSGIESVKNIALSEFSWHPPAGSRTVENPLNQRN